MSHLTRAEADDQRYQREAAAAARDLQDSILVFGPDLGPLLEAAVKVEGVPPEEIARRQDAYLVGVWNELRNSFISDDQEKGLLALKAMIALSEHENNTLKAKIAKLEMRMNSGL